MSGLKCRVVYDESNRAKVFNEDGTESVLFEKLRGHFPKQEDALDAWAMTQTSDFEVSYPKKELEVTDVLRYIDTVSSEERSLDNIQKEELKDIMRSRGYERLSDLHKDLVSIFKKEGVIGFDSEQAQRTGLYTEEEIKDLNLDEISELLVDIEGQLRLYDIEVEPFSPEELTHIDNTRKTLIGNNPLVSLQTINEELKNLADKVDDEGAFIEAVQELPYPDVVERIMEDGNFRDELLERLRGLTVVPQLYLDGQELTDENLSTFTTLKNTLPVGVDTIPIDAKIDFLKETSPFGWADTETMSEVLRDVSELLVGYNVDIIGIETLVDRPESVISLLESAQRMLDDPSSQNIKSFASIKQELLPQDEVKRIERLPQEYSGYNIVSLHTTLSDSELFDKGLIKVGEDLYHKVKFGNKSDVYEYIYEKYIDGDIKIPSELVTVKGKQKQQLGNKIRVLQDIEKYIGTRDTGLDVSDQELLSLYQVAFNHLPIEVKSPNEVIKKAAFITEGAGYLTTDFVSDFYNYYLKEKLKDSAVYQDKLSKFQITDKDITLVGEVDNLDGIELKSDLEDYIRLRKDGTMDHLLDEGLTSQANLDLVAINNPNIVQDYTGEMARQGEYIVTPKSFRDYIKVDGELFRRVIDRDDATLFLKTAKNIDPLYIKTNTDFTFDFAKASQFLEDTEVVPNNLITREDFEGILTDAGYINRYLPEGGLPTLRKSVQQTWVSTALKGLDTIQQTSATPQQWVKQIAEKGGKGTMQELEWLGVEDFLNSWMEDNNTKSIPKEIVEQYINDNQIEIVEVVKEADKSRITKDDITDAREYKGDNGWVIRVEFEDGAFVDVLPSETEDVNEAKDIAVKEYNQSIPLLDSKGDTKYSQYQLEGGENYREVLFTMPSRETLSFEEWAEQEYGDVLDLTENQLRLAKEQYENAKGDLRRGVEKGYKSSHWGEANILAHLRLNERTLPNGERVLFIEETQSDWAQEIKKKGFEGDTTEQQLTDKIAELNNRIENSNSESEIESLRQERDNVDRERRNLRGDKNIPNMPYKKTDQWVGMAMRRAMQMAAQEGFDRIAWVTGEQSADRYNLSKQVDEVGWQKNENGTYNITPKKEGEVIGTRDMMSNLTIVEVENYIGKEVAQKIEKEEGKQWSGGNVVQGNLSGQQLEVGGEGMKAFYNSILPKVAKKEAQRFDKSAKVDVVDFQGESQFMFDESLNELTAEEKQSGVASKQLSIQITPEMRMNLSAAIPLFQKAAEAQKIDTPIEVISAIESRLKQSGLSSDIVALSVDQIDVVLEEIGVSEDMRRQVVAWHGTQRKDKDITDADFLDFQKTLAEDGITLIPQGFVHGDTVYLNEEAIDPVNTLIHEHGHLFNSWAKENRPEIYKKGIELIQEQGQEYIDYVKQVQPNLTGEALLEEALTQAIGDKGARIVDESRRNSITEWLEDLWQSVKDALGITQYTAEQLQDLNLQQFAEAVSVDLLSGERFVGEQGEANFQRWKGENELVEGQEIQDVRTGQPIVAKVYHGTTNEFYEFDSSVKGSVEGYLGSVNYFTSDITDAEQNYLAEGPDLKIRIDRRAEEVSEYIVEEGLTDIDGNLDIETIFEVFNIPKEDIQNIEDIDQVSEFIAEKELKGTTDQVLELFVKLNNPAVIGRGQSWVDTLDKSQIEDYLEEATREVAEENNITEQEAKEDYEWDITMKAMEIADYQNPLIEALQTAIDESSDYVSQKTAEEVLEDFVYDQEIDLNQLENRIREGVVYEQNEEGLLISSQIVAQTFKNLGYDGIILNNPSQKFKNMSALFDTTSHIHVFDKFKNQIKLADGSNITFGETSDIRFQQQPVLNTPIFNENLIAEVSQIIDSKIKVFELYDETELTEIDSKVDECG